METKYFWEITTDEFSIRTYGSENRDFREEDYVKENWVDFTEEQINQIMEMIPNLLIQYHFRKRFLTNGWIYIIPIIDEWFLIINQNDHYICDQFDGLIEFLHHYLENKL